MPTLALVWLLCACAGPSAVEPEPLPAAPPAEVQAPEPLPPACPAPAVVATPITWNAEREALTLSYRRAHQRQAVDSVQIQPRVVVLHWTGGSTLQGAFNTFDPVRLAGRPKLADAGALNVSAHYLVDRDGTIHQLLPETTMARHVIGLNHVAVGVENVGGAEGSPLTAAQVDANVALVCWLSTRYPLEYLIGHHEYRALEQTPLFDELDPSYRTVKVDPGDPFMAQVREQLAQRGVTLSQP